MPETTPAAAPLDPSVVGTTFMRQYYQLLAKDPQSLHRFYKDESRWCHGHGSQMETPFAGQRAINEQILKRGYSGARVDLDLGSIDCQGSLDGGVVVLVTGVMTLPASPQPKPFVQTFFLAVQPKGYFVLNDCLRFLELPGTAVAASSATATAAAATDKPKALAPAAKDDKKPKDAPVKAPASPVKKPQPEAVASPAKKPQSPVKKEQPAAAKEQTPTKKADKATQKLPETKAAEPAVTPPVASPKKKAPPSPVKDKTASAAPAPSAPMAVLVAVPVAAPAPAPAEPAAPKTWAALFNKSAAAPAAPVAATPVAAAPVSAPAATPAPAPTALASAPTSATATASTEAKTTSPSKAGEPSKERSRYYSLFIRDVPAAAKEGELRDLFKGFGTVAGVNIVTGRGYAFVDFVEQDAMRAALADPREFKLQDKLLQVEERSDRKEGQRASFRSDSRGGRGGRGSYGARGVGGRSGERKDREDGRDKKLASSNGTGAGLGAGGRGDRPARDKSARRGGRADGHGGRGE